jgi:hypothetical protein
MQPMFNLSTVDVLQHADKLMRELPSKLTNGCCLDQFKRVVTAKEVLSEVATRRYPLPYNVQRFHAPLFSLSAANKRPPFLRLNRFISLLFCKVSELR